MAILENVRPETPISQGDILRGIKLHVTTADWSSDGVSAEVVDAEFCLVVSRPCACILGQKTQITVVSIEEFSFQIKNTTSTLDAYRRCFSSLRDGRDMPDRFYLGSIPGCGQGRFCARLDSFHTLLLPKEQVILDDFLRDKRVARLSRDFSRDLHLRIFRAFSELGFDDYDWYHTSDLQMVILAGNDELLVKQQDVNKQKLELQGKIMEGALNEKHRKNLENNIAKLEGDIAKIKEDLGPFQAEMMRRGAGVEQETS